ncbi:hypothetical protein KY290_019435 [Solanum tuberosum]|uniref:Retrotransposon gag domain-containing protein n=1 Tax=Solanum tuberosum TaxID=4113 RepID=A0ABQ7VH14_SOLTU|nr:hypothetical protein KY289_018562 [Solanum tuberosum]KAH0704108.1 hypothetical protein KY285_018386 [Solanum tuberosum]KAH0763362.1 hypothetical protein KY290_019435 [Solanum tuberosum]
MESIKHMEQTSNVRAYQAEFDRLLTGVNLSNENAISCFLGGRKPELNKSVKMQAPKTLMQAYKLARLQEEVFEAQAQSQGIRSAGKNQNPILPIPNFHRNQMYRGPYQLILATGNLLIILITNLVDFRAMLMEGSS